MDQTLLCSLPPPIINSHSSDAHRLSCRQVMNQSPEIIWRSVVSGDFLLTCVLNKPTHFSVSINAIRLMLAVKLWLGTIYRTVKTTIYVCMDCDQHCFACIWTLFINILEKMHSALQVLGCDNSETINRSIFLDTNGCHFAACRLTTPDCYFWRKVSS